MKIPRPAEMKKTLAALGAGVAVMVGAGLITGSAAAWGTGGIAAAIAAISVFAVPKNADAPPKDVLTTTTPKGGT